MLLATMKLMDEVIDELEKSIRDEDMERASLGAPRVVNFELKVLGQVSLIMDEAASKLLPLARTMDLDATVQGDTFSQIRLTQILKEKGMQLDHLSSEIWIPPTAFFKPYYTSERLHVTYIDPISALVTKAVKAKEKNKLLVREALKIYGEELSTPIQKYGGDLEFFQGTGGLEL